MEQLVNVDQLAGYLGVKESTVYQWVHEGKLPNYKVGKLVKFRISEVEDWLKSRHRKGRTDPVYDPWKQGP